MKRFVGGVKKVVVGAGGFLVAGAAFAQTSSSDPTSTITTTLGTYGPDIAAIVSAMLILFYGKKLYTLLKV